MIKFGSGDDVLVLIGQNQLDVLFRHRNAIARRGMRAEQLRDGSRSRAFLCLKLFKEAHCGTWIIAGLVKILQPEVIGFGFVLTRELQELHRNQEPRCLPKSEAADATHEDEWNRN